MSRSHQISTSANPAPPPVEPYVLRPPEWRGTLSSQADLGFPDFYPSRPAHGQDEDQLTESFIKQGYVSKWGISQASESFTVHGVLLKELGSQTGLAQMGSTLSSLLATRQASAPAVGPSTYRLPPRYTLPDSRRLTFVADLANPLVPLHKLSKSIPHGFKGGELLEMLWANSVSIERGVWFAQVVGANEMQRPPGKPQPAPGQYSIEWTNACSTWLKKQLAEITLPSVPRPGFNVKQAFRSVLSDPLSRERWVAKWNFSCSLIRCFWAQSLLDHRTFLSFLVQQIAPANLAQIGFVARLVEEFLEHILASGALARLMADGIATKMSDIVAGGNQGGAGEKLEEIKIGLARILQSTFLQAPTLFVSPKLYTSHSALFDLILSEAPEMTLPSSPAAREDPSAVAVMTVMREQWDEIKRRNVGLLFTSGGGGGWSPRRQAMLDINILDSICSTSDMSQISFSFFTAIPTPPPSSKNPPASTKPSPASTAEAFFPTKLDILLSWSIAYAQVGAHRPASVSTLLLHHRSRHPGCESEVQELVFKWIAESEVAKKDENREAVAEVVGELMRTGVVGYAGLLMKLMSRGLTGGFSEGSESSPLLKILRSIPLYASTPSLLSQRRVSLYGIRPSSASTDDDTLAERVTAELDAAFPELAANSVPSPNEMDDDDSDARPRLVPRLTALLETPKFMQIDCLHRWLKAKGLDASSDTINLNSELLAKLVCVLEQVRDYPTMLEFLFAALECPSSESLVSPIISAFGRYADVWTAMGARESIAEALFEKHLELRGGPSQSRELLSVLSTMGDAGLLPEQDRAVIVNDLQAFEKSLSPSSHHSLPPPSNLDEVQMLSHDANPGSGAALATTLWYRYHAFPDWPYTVWQNVVLALALLTSAVSDAAEQLVVVERYARFLAEVHKHIPGDLDRHLRRWFHERAEEGKTEDAFRGGLDGAMVQLLMRLVLTGCVETVSVLTEAMLPVWKLCALKCRSDGAEAVSSSSSLGITLKSINVLATRLVLSPPSSSLAQSSSSTNTPPPHTLEQTQRLDTSSAACFDDATFVQLVKHLPFIVALEVTFHQSADGNTLAAECGEVWKGLVKHPRLKVAAFRHTGTIKDAFLRPDWGTVATGGGGEGEVELDGRLIDVLKDLISDGAQTDPTQSPTVYDWRKVVTCLTPWRWSRSVLELQISLKQLAIRASTEATAPAAEALLGSLTRTVFERNLSSDETDLICEGLAGTEAGPIAKFALSGLDRLADLLLAFDPSSSTASTRFPAFLSSASNVLRVLSGTLVQARHQPSTPETPTQDRLPEAILEMLQKVEVELKEIHTAEAEGERRDGRLGGRQLRAMLVLGMRALHVVLGFGRMGVVGPWTTRGKASMASYLGVMMGLLAMYAGTHALEEGLFGLIIDTLWYYIDELPKDLRPTCISTLRTLQLTHAYDRNPSIPTHLRIQIRQLLPYISPDPLVDGLVLASSSPSTTSLSLAETTKARAKPWEWIEYTDPTPATPSHREAYPAVPQPVKNNGSMSLGLFLAEGTRDRVPVTPLPFTTSTNTDDAGGTSTSEWTKFESERTYSDSLDAPTTFTRDYVASRLKAGERAEEERAKQSLVFVEDEKAFRQALMGYEVRMGADGKGLEYGAQPGGAAGGFGPLGNGGGSGSGSSSGNNNKRKASGSGGGKGGKGEVIVIDDDEPLAAGAPAMKMAKLGGGGSGGAGGGSRVGGKMPAKGPHGTGGKKGGGSGGGGGGGRKKSVSGGI